MAAKKDREYRPVAEEANKGNKGLVEYCFDRYEEAKDSAYRDKKITEISESIAAYDQAETKDEQPWEGSSRVELPLTTISCDNLEPRIVSGMLGKKPYIQFELPNGQEKDQNTEIIEEWYNQELEDVVQVEPVVSGMTGVLLREGTIYPIASYDRDDVTRKDFVFASDVIQWQQSGNKERLSFVQAVVESGARFIPENNPNGVLTDKDGAVTIDVLDNVFEGCKLDIVPFKDVFIPDNVDEWEKAPVIRKIYPTYAELVRDSQSKPGFISKNIGHWLCDETIDKLSEDQLSPSQMAAGVKQHGKKVIECLECYVSYIYRDDDIEDDKEVDSVEEERIVVQIALDSKVLLRVIPLREINFKNEHLIKRIRLFPRKGESYGSSIYAKMKSIQRGASKTFNTAINIADITILPFFFFEEKSGLSKYKDGIKLEIGKGIKVDDVSGILFPRFAVNPDQLLNWINLWVSFWERLLSIGDLQVGRQGEKDRTATEALAVIQEGNIKHNYQSLSIKAEFLPVLKTIYDLYYQFMPFTKRFLWNKAMVEIPRSAMRRPYVFRLTGSTDLSNKLIQRQEQESFYNLTARDPNINPIKRAEELVKSYGYTDQSEWVAQGVAPLFQQIMASPDLLNGVKQFVQEASQAAAQMQEMAKQGAPNAQ